MKGSLLLIAFLAAGPLLPHGEDRPGPHGGSIRMPGAFHTEVAAARDGFKVYLLDIQFENPITAGSEVNGRITVRNQTRNIVCRPHADHFFCEGNPSEGTLFIKARRGSAQGMEVRYELPLSLPSRGREKHHE